jgi:hypothetical protein
MKKLKLFIVLALLPAILIGCGKSDAEKAKEGAQTINQHLDSARAIGKEIVAMKITSVESASNEELLSLRSKVLAIKAHYQYAIELDNKGEDVYLSGRAEVERAIREATELLADIDAEIAKRAADKSKPDQVA